MRDLSSDFYSFFCDYNWNREVYSSLDEKRSHFRQVFNSNKGEENSLDYAFETVRREIRQLTGEKIGKETVKNFYYGEGDPKFIIVMSIMRWVDNKEITNSLAE